ncbi:hypothetical protein LTR48_008989, partial [Friedmanniomyces endolithicus]
MTDGDLQEAFKTLSVRHDSPADRPRRRKRRRLSADPSPKRLDDQSSELMGLLSGWTSEAIEATPQLASTMYAELDEERQRRTWDLLAEAAKTEAAKTEADTVASYVSSLLQLPSVRN